MRPVSTLALQTLEEGTPEKSNLLLEAHLKKHGEGANSPINFLEGHVNNLHHRVTLTNKSPTLKNLHDLQGVIKLLSCLPHRVVERLANTTNTVAGVSNDLTAVVAFYDISGFSTYATKLMDDEDEVLQAELATLESMNIFSLESAQVTSQLIRGVGTEELAEFVNKSFTLIIQQVFAFNGDVIKFAGDALLCIWHVNEHQNLLEACTRSLHCSKTIQQMAKQKFGLSDTKMSLHGGLAIGPVKEYILGDETAQWEYFIGGKTVEHTYTAEKLSKKGEMTCHVDMKNFCDSTNDFFFTQAEENKDFFTVERQASAYVPTHDFSELWEAYVTKIRTTLHLNRIKKHTPVLLRGSLVKHGLNAYLVKVSTIFIKFRQFDDILDDVTELNDLFLNLQTTVAKSGGCISQFLIDDKGAVAVIGIGIPPFSVHHRESRAITCARRVRSVCSLYDKVAVSIGVTTGMCYCGIVGTERRREYATVGDKVITAARLMGLDKKCQILCDGDTRMGSLNTYDFELWGTPILKGKKSALQVYTPVKRKMKSILTEHETNECYGRIEERKAFNNFLQIPRKLFLIIEGKPGIGKTNFMGAMLDEIEKKQKTKILYGCVLGGDEETQFNAWRSIIVEVFALQQQSNSIIFRKKEINRKKSSIGSRRRSNNPMNAVMSKMEQVQFQNTPVGMISKKSSFPGIHRFNSGSLTASGSTLIDARMKSARKRKSSRRKSMLDQLLHKTLTRTDTALDFDQDMEEPQILKLFREKHPEKEQDLGLLNLILPMGLRIPKFIDHVPQSDRIVKLCDLIIAILNIYLKVSFKDQLVLVFDNYQFVDRSSRVLLETYAHRMPANHSIVSGVTTASRKTSMKKKKSTTFLEGPPLLSVEEDVTEDVTERITLSKLRTVDIARLIEFQLSKKKESDTLTLTTSHESVASSTSETSDKVEDEVFTMDHHSIELIAEYVDHNYVALIELVKTLRQRKLLYKIN